MRRARRHAAGKRYLIAVALILGAAWVNRETIVDLSGWEPEVDAVADSGDSFHPDLEHTPAATPLAESDSFRPVALTESIADPMLRAAAAFKGSGATNSDESKALVLPVVQLILHCKQSQRALVEGQILGVGDMTRVGEIVEIQPEAVKVKTEGGLVRTLQLRAPEKPAPSDSIDTAPANASPTPQAAAPAEQPRPITVEDILKGKSK